MKYANKVMIFLEKAALLGIKKRNAPKMTRFRYAN